MRVEVMAWAKKIWLAHIVSWLRLEVRIRVEVRGQGSKSVQPISTRVMLLIGSGCGPGAQKLESANRRDIDEGRDQGKNRK